jgi:hypothetical protein
MKALASISNPLAPRSGAAAAVTAVGLVSGGESFGQTRLRLVVELATFAVQFGDDRLELGAGLQEFQAFGDQCGHRLGAAFLYFAGGPVIEFLAERNADLLGHILNYASGQSAGMATGAGTARWAIGPARDGSTKSHTGPVNLGR